MLMTESKIREIISQEIENKKYQKMMEQALPPGGSGDWPLKQGSEGRWVTDLQTHLGIAADGIFGPDTEAALVAETGSTEISAEAYRDLLGLSTTPGVDPGEPQRGSLSAAEIEILNTALANTEGIQIPEEYKKAGSSDLRDFWPAWAQFLLLHYEPRLIDQETGNRFEGAIDPREVYSKWDEIAQEQIGFEGTDVGAIQFIQALGEPKAPSAMATLLGGGPLDPRKMAEYLAERKGEIQPKVEAMQDKLTFPVYLGDLKLAADIFAEVVKNDDDALINTRIFNAIYAIENTSIGELLGDTALAAGAFLVTPAFAMTLAPLAMGASILGTGVAAGTVLNSLFSGRSITSMIKDGFDEEAAILTSLNSDEMATDIGRVTFLANAEGDRLRDALVDIAESLASDTGFTYTKQQALDKLDSVNVSISEGATLTRMIDMIIKEVAMTVPDAEIPPFGSQPFDAEEAAEEEEAGEDVDAGERGRARRAAAAAGTAQAALDPARAADVAAATGAPGAYARAQTRQERQRQRTARTDIRQAGRTQRAAQRQGARAERRDQRAERQAARGERRAAAATARQGARAERVQGRRDAAAARRAARRGEAEAAE